MTHEQDLNELRAEVVEHGVLDYDQAIPLLDRAEAAEKQLATSRVEIRHQQHMRTVAETRAEAAEQALDFHTQRDRELKALLSMIACRLDEFCYDELASLIQDGPLNQWGESYKSKLQAAEAAVQRVREVATGEPTAYGWGGAMDTIIRALDGGEQE